eukprot:gene3136-1441_t
MMHSSRRCLLARKGKCTKKNCLARQAILENLFKSCALALVHQTLNGRQGSHRTPCGANDGNSSGGNGISTNRRGRGYSRTGCNRSNDRSKLSEMKRRKMHKPPEDEEPRVKIYLAKYVNSLIAAKIPLKRALTLHYDVPKICRHYLGRNDVTNAEILAIWRYHKRNYRLISYKYKKIVGNVMCAEKFVEAANDLVEKVHSSLTSAVSREPSVEETNSNVTSEKVANADARGKEREADHSFDQLDCDKGESLLPITEIKKGQEIGTDAERDCFEDFGLSEKLASLLTGSDITGRKEFKKKMDGVKRVMPLDPVWRNLEIKTLKGGSRRFAGEWTAFFSKMIEKFNPFCVFAFKHNHIKNEASRKKKSPFFKASGFCTIKKCKCNVLLCIESEHSKDINIDFRGDAVHDASNLRARRMTGTERNNLKDVFRETSSKPSGLYRQKLKEITADAYSAGNRSGCGVSAKAFQHISAEAKALESDASIVAEKIRASDKKIRDYNRVHFKSMMEKQTILGFVQSNDVTNDSLCVVLFDEEFNYGMTVESYVNQCYDMLQGKCANISITLVLICAAHISKSSAKFVERHAGKRITSDNLPSVKHLVMRIIGLLTNIETMEDATDIIKLAYIAFMSEFTDPNVQDALDNLSRIVNEFRMNTKENAITDNDNEADCIVVASKSSNKFKKHIERHLQAIDLPIDVFETRNKYFFPEYMDYFQSVLVPYLPLWTRIMLSLERSPVMKSHSTTGKSLVGKRMFDVGNTNAYAENYFAFIKQSFSCSSVPIDEFIYKHFQNVCGLRRQFIDSLRVNSSKNTGSLKRLERSTPRYPNDENVLCEKSSEAEMEEEEEWQKPCTRKDTSHISGQYSEPPTTPIVFKATPKLINRKIDLQSNKGIRSKEDRMRFNAYKAKNWSSVSKTLPTTEKCITELRRRFLNLSDSEKQDISTPKSRGKEVYCICKQSFRPSGSCMVQCNVCEDWFHSSCIKLEDEFLANMIPRYHCSICLEKLFRGTAQLVSHYDDRINDDASGLIKQVFEEFDLLDPAIKAIVCKHLFLDTEINRHYPSIDLLGHDRGITNNKNNCWLNCIAQVMCGTGIADLLFSYDGSKDLPISQALLLCRLRLMKNQKAPLSLRMVEDVGLHAQGKSSQGERFDASSGTQRDASEFYATIITNYLESVPSEEMINDLQFVCLDLRCCLNCKGMAGSVHRNTMFNVAVVDSPDPVKLTNLIWLQLMGKHYDDPSYSKTVCREQCKNCSVWEATVIHNFPTILVIQLKRATWQGRGRIVQTPVDIEKELDLEQYSARKTHSNHVYKLKAAVSHYAYTSGSGHYATHLFDKKTVKTFDDTSVKVRNADSFMNLQTFKKSCHLLFFFLEPKNKNNYSLCEVPTIPRAEQRLVERYWFGMLEPATPQLTAHDLRTLCHGMPLNGDVVSHFIFAASRIFSESNILATSGTFYANFCRNRFSTSEVSSFLSVNAINTYDVIIIPVNSEECHWVVVAIYPKSKCIVLANSLRQSDQGRTIFYRILSLLKLSAELHDVSFYQQEWTLLNPRTLQLQTDESSCGVFACINAYNCMFPSVFYSVNAQNLLLFRYWIAQIASSFHETVSLKRQSLPENVSDVDINVISKNLQIRDSVPGYGKVNFFFVTLKKYVDSRHEASNEDYSLESQAVDGTHSTDDSIYLEQQEVEKKLTSLQHLKKTVLKRLVLNLKTGNERYMVLAFFGKEKLISLFKRELRFLGQLVTDVDMELLKGALYKMFCNEVPEHEYFGVSLPTVSCMRYGLTSVQFIDYIILPDLLCLDYMDTKGTTYEEAVRRSCGENGSRLTVYWNHALCADSTVKVRRTLSNNCQIQGVLNELQNERVNCIVAEVNDVLQPMKKNSEKVLSRAGMTNLSPFEENNKFVDGCMVCKPGDLKCDKLVLTRAVEPSCRSGVPKSMDVMNCMVERILLETTKTNEASVAIPLLCQHQTKEGNCDTAAKQVEYIYRYIRNFEMSPLLVVRLVAETADELELIKKIIIQQE